MSKCELYLIEINKKILNIKNLKNFFTNIRNKLDQN